MPFACILSQFNTAPLQTHMTMHDVWPVVCERLRSVSVIAIEFWDDRASKAGSSSNSSRDCNTNCSSSRSSSSEIKFPTRTLRNQIQQRPEGLERRVDGQIGHGPKYEVFAKIQKNWNKMREKEGTEMGTMQRKRIRHREKLVNGISLHCAK